MLAKTRAWRLRKLAAPAIVAAALGALAGPLPSANAQPYLGWDFGGGVGIGIGPPPSAYNPCPNYGWPVYPYPCAYRYYGRAHHSQHYRRNHQYSRAVKPPSAPAATEGTSTPSSNRP